MDLHKDKIYMWDKIFILTIRKDILIKIAVGIIWN